MTARIQRSEIVRGEVKEMNTGELLEAREKNGLRDRVMSIGSVDDGDSEGAAVGSLSGVASKSKKWLDAASEGRNKDRNGVKQKELRCMFSNVRSILNNFKLQEIAYTLNSNNLDIFGVAESWIHEMINDSELLVPGYVLFRRDKGANDIKI